LIAFEVACSKESDCASRALIKRNTKMTFDEFRQSLTATEPPAGDELRGRRLVEKVDARMYFLTKWREKDDPGQRDQ